MRPSIFNRQFSISNHDAGPPYTPVLNGTAQNDLILGLGGNDILNGLGGNDILVGGNGNDQANGGLGNDNVAYLGNETGFDTNSGGGGVDRVIAVQAGAVIGVTHVNNDFASFEGPAGTIIRGASSLHKTLDFTNVAFVGIAEIDGNTGGNDTFSVSTVSDATYRGNVGNDIFHLQGGKNVTLLYSGTSNGFDQFIDGGFTGTANAIAETAGTTIGLVAYNNQLDSIQGTGDTVVRGSDSVHDVFNFATTTLTGVALIDTGGGNDTITLSGISACQYRGGTGNNTFVVPSAGTFEDQILDFDSTDKINYTLSGLGLPVITIEGADKVLTFSNGRKVRLTGYTGSVTLV